MQFSQTYIAAIVAILAFVLPRLGLTIGSDELTNIVSTVLQLGGMIWVLVRRYQQGGINIAGKRI
jgi:hypothetical protein